MVTGDAHGAGDTRRQERFEGACLRGGDGVCGAVHVPVVDAGALQVLGVGTVGCDDERAGGVVAGRQVGGAAEPAHEGGVGVGAGGHEREELILLELHFCDGCEHAAGVVAGGGVERRAVVGGAVVAGFGVDEVHVLAAFGELKRGGEANDSAANNRDGHGYACNAGLSTKARTMAIPATPVVRMAGQSSGVMSPIATVGTADSSASSRSPSMPRGGRLDCLVGLGRNGPVPM